MLKRLLQVLAVAVACSASAQGNFEAINSYSTSTNPVVSTSTGTVGWKFQPAADIKLTALGCFDSVFSQQGTIYVGLWDDSGMRLASTTNTQTSPLVNQSRYELITPVSLSASRTYYIGASSASGTIVFNTLDLNNGDSITWAPEVRYKGAVDATTGFGFPTNDYGTNFVFLAPNFRVQQLTNIVFTDIILNTNGVLLKWLAPPNSRFKVQWTADLNNLTWLSFTNVVTSPTDSYSFLDDGSQTGGFGSSRFYRLQQLP